MKLGIVGSGMIVEDLLSFIDNIPNIQLIHISGTKRSEEKVKNLCKKHHFKRCSTSYDQLLNDEEVDTIYVALPNHLHYEYTRQALQANKNVILEKPFTSTIEEAQELEKLAIENHLFLWEAITNQYLPNFYKVKELLPKLGRIKIVECNFSQYSSRYNAFKEGNILPAFDYTKSGGALMDLNIYNIHFVVGLFGKPINIEYYPNIERNIDTSGILILDYGSFKCVCIGSKDCKAPLSNNIQGDEGCIHIETPVAIIETIDMFMNDGTKETITENKNVHKMYEEFMAFEKMYQEKNYQKCYEMLKHSLLVTEVQTIARRKAGMLFPADIQK
ncbi:MAG: Gfo/Idh/MocA family oxidoreductase [Coprobacillus sp.]|nr:Gfo/Idh/MocA family oxidoreductase [Coprobacillus sp.]